MKNLNRKKMILKTAAMTAASLLFLSGCITHPLEKPVPQRPVIQGVKIQTVKKQIITSYNKVVGTIIPQKTARLSSKIMGRILSITASQGEHVTQGTALVFISARAIQNKEKEALNHYKQSLFALEEAEQEKKLALVTWKRYRNLFAQKAISPQEMDEISTKKKLADLELSQAESAVKMGKSSLNQTKIMLSYSEIDAPFSGIVIKKIAHSGDMAIPGSPLLILEDNSEYFLKAHPEENLLPVLKKGMKIQVKIPSFSKTIEGEIVRINPVVNPETRTFPIKISLKGKGLKSGVYATAEIPDGKKRVILVPEKAIVRKGDLTGVYTINSQGIVSYRLVQTGNRIKGSTEIASGLRPGDRILVQGLSHVIDGGIIKPSNSISSSNSGTTP
ncbi:MAG: efflux RND transporter periplasmic adaptor subunit [Firmicutes bacterium]|nr:efflux RND transporter periplasmic adaptor subunit [Bacillota bacterium]